MLFTTQRGCNSGSLRKWSETSASSQIHLVHEFKDQPYSAYRYGTWEEPVSSGNGRSTHCGKLYSSQLQSAMLLER